MTDFTAHLLSPSSKPAVEAFLERHNPFDAMFFRSGRMFPVIDNTVKEIWGSFDPNGELQALLKLTSERAAIRCYVLWDNTEALSPLVQLIKSQYTQLRTSGQAHQIEPFLACFGPDEVIVRQEGTACVLRKDTFQAYRFSGVRKAGWEDIDHILWLFSENIGEERAKIEYAIKHATVFVLEVDGQIVSTGHTDVETQQAAHITGVATHPDHQNQGYATCCSSALCEDVLVRCEGIFLTYADGNESAGKVYKKLGFVPLSEKRVRARLVLKDAEAKGVEQNAEKK